MLESMVISPAAISALETLWESEDVKEGAAAADDEDMFLQIKRKSLRGTPGWGGVACA